MFVDQGVLETAGLIVTLAEWYGWAGLAVAAVFLGIGVDRVEPSARGVYLFRVMVLPGVIGLWPLVLWRWLHLERRGED